MNTRLLESRNKREGWYFGKTAGFKKKGKTTYYCKKPVRTWSKPAALRYSHIQFGQVRFEGLGIQLHTLTGEPNGNT